MPSFGKEPLGKEPLEVDSELGKYQKEDEIPPCQICGGKHRTTDHGNYKKDKDKEMIMEIYDPICDICKGRHKTSEHYKVTNENENINEKTEPPNKDDMNENMNKLEADKY